MYTIDNFITQRALSMKTKPVDSNPYMTDDNFSRSASHFRCYIRAGKARMSVTFSVGSGIIEAYEREHPGEQYPGPELADVLDCLANDAANFDDTARFVDWARGYGYDEGSRKAERTYKHVAKQSNALERVLGEEAYQVLLFETERL